MSGRLLFLVDGAAGDGSASPTPPGWQLRPVAGIPLVARAIRTARRAASALGEPDAVIACVTSDPAVAAVAAAWHAVVIEEAAELTAGGGFRGVVRISPAAPLLEPRALVEAAGRLDPPGSTEVTVGGSIGREAPGPDDLLAAEAIVAARPIRTFHLDGRLIGEGVFVIAEAGVNHNGDPALAHRLVDAAADAGADCVKFQTFDPAALASAAAPTAEYQQRAGAHDDQRAMLQALVLPDDAWPALRDHARERGLVFLSSPFDDASADLLDRLGVPAFKVASGELTNTPFVERLARRGRPLLVSTGMAEMVEVADAIDAIADAGDPPVALFHCVSSYPASPGDANLRAMETMRRAFGVPVGWSDHTPGVELPIAAAALGATLIEKHLTLDRTMVGPDHAASLEPAAFRAMVDGIRIATAARGDGVKRPVPAERPIADVARKSLHWATSLPAGTIVTPVHLSTMRPGTGMRPADLPRVTGRVTVRAVEAGRALVLDDLEDGRPS